MSRFTAALILAVLSLFTPDVPVHGIEIPTSFGQGADAFMERSKPDSSYGGGPTVVIKNDSGIGNLDRIGYWRFDLADVVGDVDAATLSFTFTGAGGSSAANSTYQVYGLVDGHPGEAWDEASVTWNNAPANDTGSGTALLAGEATLLGTFSVTTTDPPGTTVPFSSAELLTFLQADTDLLATIMIVRSQANFGSELFAAKENTDYAPARLDLQTTTSVAPMSWAATKATFR